MKAFIYTSLLLGILLPSFEGSSQSFKTNNIAKTEQQVGSLKKPLHGALMDKNGAVMRGTPMVLGKAMSQSVAFAQNIENWHTLQQNGFNTIRVCWVDPWYWNHRNDGWKVNEVLPYLDQVVQNAAITGMNIIINFHNVGAQQEYDKAYQFALENEFWKAVAPRYKDNELVYYEPANEPTFTMSDYLKNEFRKPYLELYNTIRTLAPSRQVLFFSFNGITPDILKVVDAYENDIDWNYTTVAYHMYNSTSSESIRAVMERHPVICTEWFYDHVSRLPGNEFIKQVDGYKLNAQTMEKMGSGWCDWRDWGDVTLNETIDTLIADARMKNYWWGKPINGLKATGISISHQKLELKSGQSKKLFAFVLPALVSDQRIKWSTSDASLATVDINGKVTVVAHDNAKVTITASSADEKYHATCEVSVIR